MADRSGMAGPAHLDVRLDHPGRTFGAMRIPWSDDRSGYGQIVVPVIIINNGEGPTALLTGGVHGDEYEGQIVLGALARRLDPAKIRGRLVIVPCANPAASLAGRRTSPLDQGNLARLFPGDPAAGPTSQIAEGITRLLLREADYLVDFHSGGHTLDYLPCAFGRIPEEPALAERVLDLLLAFGAPVTAVVRRPEARGTLVATALDLGIVAMATELGGSGGVTQDTVELAERGLLRALAHMGILESQHVSPPTRLLGIEAAHFVRSPGHGLFAPTFMLGDQVERGDRAGLLCDALRPDRTPEEIVFAASGVVLCRRVPAMAQAGDVLVHLGEDITRDALISR
jgi:predicted deacylase